MNQATVDLGCTRVYTPHCTCLVPSRPTSTQNRQNPSIETTTAMARSLRWLEAEMNDTDAHHATIKGSMVDATINYEIDDVTGIYDTRLVPAYSTTAPTAPRCIAAVLINSPQQA